MKHWGQRCPHTTRARARACSSRVEVDVSRNQRTEHSAVARLSHARFWHETLCSCAPLYSVALLTRALHSGLSAHASGRERRACKKAASNEHLRKRDARRQKTILPDGSRLLAGPARGERADFLEQLLSRCCTGPFRLQLGLEPLDLSLELRHIWWQFGRLLLFFVLPLHD